MKSLDGFQGNSQKLIYPQHTPTPSQEGNKTVESPLLRGE